VYLSRLTGPNALLTVPPAKVAKLASDLDTFCVKRFDRRYNARRFYASAMTLLDKDVSEGTSYLELAQFLANHGDPDFVAADLNQLFCRVAFNVAVGNRDDHLRNHGFLLGARGWRLAPAFDVNPNVDKSEHVLNLDDVDNRPSLTTVLNTASFYRLNEATAMAIIDKVVAAVSRWQTVARQAGISRAEIELMASAFGAHADWPPSIVP
jgi:serine/threonine-protein kinase HipA